MTSRERVIEVIKHRKPDRTPVFGWLGNEEFAPKVIERFGSMQAAVDRYEFDIQGCGPNLSAFRWDLVHDLRMTKPDKKVTPEDILDIPLTDPDDESAYAAFKTNVAEIKENKGRFVYTQTWGYFEGYTTMFSIEDHLMNLALYPEALHELHRRLAAWNLKFANNVLDCGTDMVHFSDDWGAQRGLLFNPKTWWELFYPYYVDVSSAIHKRGGYMSLHSDGNVSQVLDGLVKIGFDVVHPFQESAGMDLNLYNTTYRQHFTMMGGMDVQSTIGFGRYDHLRHEIERILTMFKDGGLIFCTSHAIQPHCTIEEFIFAYDLIYDFVRH